MKSLLAGHGEQARLIQEGDWSPTPLDDPEHWPVALKTLVGVMLGANRPLFVVWGPDRTLIYNDCYIDVLQDKQTAMLIERTR